MGTAAQRVQRIPASSESPVQAAQELSGGNDNSNLSGKTSSAPTAEEDEMRSTLRTQPSISTSGSAGTLGTAVYKGSTGNLNDTNPDMRRTIASKVASRPYTIARQSSARAIQRERSADSGQWQLTLPGSQRDDTSDNGSTGERLMECLGSCCWCAGCPLCSCCGCSLLW